MHKLQVHALNNNEVPRVSPVVFRLLGQTVTLHSIELQLPKTQNLPTHSAPP